MSKELVNELAKHPFLEGVAKELVAKLVDCVEGSFDYPEDEVLFRSGGEAKRCYLIYEGEVAIEIHSPGAGSRIVQTVARGQVLGWSWLFEPYRTTFDARVLTPVKAIVLDGTKVRTCMDDHPDLGFAMMRRYAQLIGARLQATRLQLLDLYASRN
jgi:CRP-like cAMP-binding protein